MSSPQFTTSSPAPSNTVILSLPPEAKMVSAPPELETMRLSAERATLVEAIQQDVGATLQRYTHDDEINVPMAAYVATAHIPAS